MSFFQVTSANLLAKADELESINAQFKSQTDQLSTTEQSLNSMWEGEANNAFHAAFQRDKAQMDNFHSAITQYVQALRSIAAKYAQAESQNVSIAATRNY